jgi:hypothetical protein
MPACLLARPESDVENEMSENELEMPDLLYRNESSESEDEMHVLKPVKRRCSNKQTIRNKEPASRRKMILAIQRWKSMSQTAGHG